jgi:protein-tyrosine phosphatase
MKSMSDTTAMKRILFVCLGNICRSPTAHGVFAHHVAEAGLSDRIYIDSAGTGDWHIGKPPDVRTQQAALRRGFDLSSLRARRVVASDFEKFDLILAMDKQNYQDLYALAAPNHLHKIRLFLEYGNSSLKEVPDPYYGGEEGFSQVLDLVVQASSGLLEKLQLQMMDRVVS